MDKKSKDIKHELDTLIKARYVLIYLITFEELRAQDFLRNIAKDQNKELFTWNIAQGIVKDEDASLLSKDEKTRDPESALDFIVHYNNAAIFCLNDFHPYLDKPTIIRKLKNTGFAIRNTRKNIVLLGPVLSIPIELEKEITVVDFDLPTYDQIKELLSNMIENYKNNPRVTINLSEQEIDVLVKAAHGLTYSEIEGVFSKALTDDKKLNANDINLVLSEKVQIIRKTGILESISPKETFMDVGGLENLKKWIDKRKKSFTQEAKEYGLPSPKGILITGIPGCGKSLCAKATANEWKLPLLRLDMGRIFGSLVGASESNIRMAIKIAESISPSILWIDEIEKGLSGTKSEGDSGTSARVFGTILTWMQEKESPTFIIATANDIERLPPELLRKGRFDEIFFVDLPTSKEREQIFKIHLKKFKRDPEKYNIAEFSKKTDGFSGADIEQVVIDALFDSFNKGQELDNGNIFDAIHRTVPLASTMKEKLSEIRKWANERAVIASLPEKEISGETINISSGRQIEF